MVDALAHRGPDASGTHLDQSVALGHTRLSIIDLSDDANQPMVSADGRYVLVYNGEIYNFRDLRTRLASEGCSFSTRSDTEVVLKALITWGTQALHKLHGMFAFAFWDRQTSTLQVARDRFGIKPLYYSFVDNRFIFASEIKALLATGSVRPRISPAGFHEYLYYGNALGERTLWKGICRLLPGHMAVASPDGTEIAAWWKPPPTSAGAFVGRDTIEATSVLLESAVRSHLVSDVPVAVMLSGGIDSSAIASYAARQSDRELSTYSIGFEGGATDERPLARRTAELLGTAHSELVVSPGDLRDLLRDIVRCHDQPFGDAANIPLFLATRELAGRTKVVLQGDGGDEIFGGYRRYLVLHHLRFWLMAASLARYIPRRFDAHRLLHRMRRFVDAMSEKDAALRSALLLTQEPSVPRPTMCLTSTARDLILGSDPFERYRAIYSDETDSAVQSMLRTDAQILLPDIFLEKVDRPSMAHGVEVRVPFLDVALTDYVMRLPANVKLQGGKKKWLLKKALVGVVPDFVLAGTKRGFGVPYSQWLRTSLRPMLREYVCDPKGSAGLIDTAYASALIDDHVSGKRDNGFILYKLLQFSVWCSEYGVTI